MDGDVLNKCLDKSPNVIFRKIADEFVLVPIHKEAVDLEALFSLNQTGARIWELLDGKTAGVDIAGVISSEFSLDSKVANSDVAEFLNALGELKFVE